MNGRGVNSVTSDTVLYTMKGKGVNHGTQAKHVTGFGQLMAVVLAMKHCKSAACLGLARCQPLDALLYMVSVRGVKL